VRRCGDLIRRRHRRGGVRGGIYGRATRRRRHARMDRAIAVRIRCRSLSDFGPESVRTGQDLDGRQ
jgi:hypothetical protein